jgi:aryl-phospho-beta-D-glucosidase BglC (GH1 family)
LTSFVAYKIINHLYNITQRNLDYPELGRVGSEISWGNSVTNKKMIDSIKAAGFNIIRIPTTWEKHFGPAPECIIDEKRWNRVQERTGNIQR